MWPVVADERLIGREIALGAAGEDLVGVVERAKAITGRFDPVHLNKSWDEFASSRDRQADDIACLREAAGR